MMPRHLRSIALAVAVTVAPSLASTAAGQSLLDRTPNLSGGWLGEQGTLQFNFLHRFTVSPPPLRNVDNSPTFLLAYRLPFPVLVGINYATSSDIVPGFPNEWEVFGRYARQRLGPVDVAAQLGYNQAAESVDGELALGRSIDRLRLLAVGRYLSDGYAAGETRYAVGGGSVVRLHRHVALAGDVTTLLDRKNGEEVAWGAALQLAIPYSPHTLSLQVTNTSTGTLQGSSRGSAGNRVRGGFEFTIPFTLSRYFGKRAAAAATTGPAAGATVEMRQMAFAPQRLEITAGTTIEWTNRDQLAHTITADDGSWDSGLIEPGKTWRRTFDQPGTYAVHCTPHPFMTGVIVVR